MEGLFDLQRTLAMRLARSLGGTLASAPTGGSGNAPTRSLEAYNYFLRGLHHWNTMTRESWEAAEDDFRQAITLEAGASIDQGLEQLFLFLGQQGCAVELDHLQGTLHLMHMVQAEAQARQVLRTLDERLQGLAGLLEGFRDFAFNPLQGDIVVPITHSDSTH